jgi:hypothetical protein
MILSMNWVMIFSLVFQVVTGFLPAPSRPGSAPSQAGKYEVRIHPDLPLEIGDEISFEIYSSPGTNLQDQQITVSLEAPQVKQLGQGNFVPTVDNRFRAELQWVWDTHGFQPGQYTLAFTIKPAEDEWQQMVELQPAPANSLYRWAVGQTECCNVHYITGTPAERDLPRLLPQIEDQVRQVENELKHTLAAKIEIDLLPRVLGQGGFTADEIFLSYPADAVNYLDSDLMTVLHHEVVHRVDADMGGEFRPLFLIEGLAVYLAGGHYHSEPLGQRAATLLDTGAYIPLPNLVNNFYNWQHEIGYLEAGSLVQFMVNTWGWDAYNNFYRDIHPVLVGNDGAAIDKALQAHFGLSLSLLDDRFQVYLKSFAINPDLRDDVTLTAELFDDIRLYQQKWDPSAYFQEVWLPDPSQMRSRGIVADYLPRSGTVQNMPLEKLLISAGVDWQKGNFSAALQQMQLIQRQLQ